MIHYFAATAGGLLVFITWLSVLRTVFIPRERSSGAARWTLKVVSSAALRTARALRTLGTVPGKAAERVLETYSPLVLMVMAAGWLLGTGLGFALLGWGVAGTPAAGLPTAGLLPAESAPQPVQTAAAWSTMLLVAVLTTHLIRLTDAYSRRERQVTQLASQAMLPTDAEAVLADYLRTGSRDNLDGRFAEWAAWMSDVQGTHLGYPSLVHYRPAGRLCWVQAAVIVLDAAALTQAIAPNWAPPNTRSLLDAGTRCLRGLADRLGLIIPHAAVSLQGREEHEFSATMRLAIQAGLPAERHEALAQEVFQDLRTRYAPYAAAIATHLLYDQDATKFIDGEIDSATGMEIR
ncbi:hypothetical protein [Allonocardiopsis opalescens]|uniref:Uncharacterized protein n=1 Tax=Allonocardiopsis opalescens TaxID=1144618 RepID=A0A2T0PZZ7_9ACTN|nr:hypothetical protein [Allonocardiopsis opalescens]PRX97104.1 hypothetical protein CLV72_106140 [Allonocardiopsis opalescens]